MHERPRLGRLSILALLIILAQPLTSDSHGVPASRRSKIEEEFNPSPENRRVDVQAQKGKSYFKDVENPVVHEYPRNLVQTLTNIRDSGVKGSNVKADYGNSNLSIKGRVKEEKEELKRSAKYESDARRRSKREILNNVPRFVVSSKTKEKRGVSREDDVSAKSTGATENRERANVVGRNEYNDESMAELGSRLDYAQEVEEESLLDRENGEARFSKGKYRVPRAVARGVEEGPLSNLKSGEAESVKGDFNILERQDIKEGSLGDSSSKETEFEKDSLRDSRSAKRSTQDQSLKGAVINRKKSELQKNNPRIRRSVVEEFPEKPLKNSNNKETELEEDNHRVRRSVPQKITEESVKSSNREAQECPEDTIISGRESEFQKSASHIRRSMAQKITEAPLKDSNIEKEESLRDVIMNRKESEFQKSNPRIRRSVVEEFPEEPLKNSNNEKAGLEKDNHRVRRSVVQEIPEEPLQDSSNKDVDLVKENPRGSRIVADETDKYTDQEERSSQYDDFEPKDVVKRGILGGAGDYEEMDDEEDSPGDLEDTVALEQEDSTNEEAEKSENHESRVKRDHSNTEDQKEIVEAKDDGSLNTANEAKLAQRLSKRNVPLEKGNSINEEKSHLNAETNKVSKKREDDKAKSQGDKIEVHLSEDKGTIADVPNPSESSKIEDPSIADLSSHEASKLDDSSNLAKALNDELKDVSKVEDSKVSENDASKGTKKADWGEDYEKRVEEEIQRKIDSIKEEIKRDIELKQRAKEIEENNARFDELREQEDDDEDRQSLVGEKKEEHRSVSKRSTGTLEIDARASKEKRSTSRKKRQNKGEEEKGAIRPIKKREYVRQVILVKDHGGEKEKRSERRRKRSRNLKSTPVKLMGQKVADLNSDSNLHESQSVNKALPSSSVSVEGDRVAPGRRRESMASLAADGQELNAGLATDYKEAFGGLQSEPAGALARFKRIKRVLRAPKSRT